MLPQRTWQIWSFAFVFAVKSLALRWRFTYGRGGMTEGRKKVRRERLATWLREGLIKLGPTFIKIGQQFSTRVDVLSREFIAELEKVRAPFRGKKEGRASLTWRCLGNDG